MERNLPMPEATGHPAPAGERRRRRHGFTLVELLVVIGIIALLISILLPSLNAARRQATRIACAANIRSIGQSYQLYAAEYKGSYPPVQMWHWPLGNWGNPWTDNPDANHNPSVPDGAGLLFSLGYVKDPRIYYCPAQEEISWYDWQDMEQHWTYIRTTGPGKGGGPGYSTVHNGYHHYANWYDQWQQPGHDGHPANRGVVKDGKRYPAQIARSTRDKGDRVLATDLMMRRVEMDWEVNYNGHLLSEGRKRPNNRDPKITVNFEGGNVLYNDGHAEWKNVSDTEMRWAQPGWMEGYW